MHEAGNGPHATNPNAGAKLDHLIPRLSFRFMDDRNNALNYTPCEVTQMEIMEIYLRIREMIGDTGAGWYRGHPAMWKDSDRK